MADEDDMDSIEAQELLEMEIDRLRTENERLQRDVLRYRWLREFVTRPDDVAMMFDELGFSGDATPEGFDRAVDAAMAGEPNAKSASSDAKHSVD